MNVCGWERQSKRVRLFVPWGPLSRWLIGNPPPSSTRVLSLMPHRGLVSPHCSSTLCSVVFNAKDPSCIWCTLLGACGSCSRPEKQLGRLWCFWTTMSNRNKDVIKHTTLCKFWQVLANDKGSYSPFGLLNMLFISRGARLGWKLKYSSFCDLEKKESQSAALLLILVFNVDVSSMQINELAKQWLEFHTCLIGISTKIHGASPSGVIHYEISRVTLRRTHLAPAIHFV